MDILVRDIDPKYIAAIDLKVEELSQKQGRRFSRNDYLKMLIKRDSVSRMEDIMQDKFDRALENLISVLERHTSSLQEYIDTNNELLLVLYKHSDVDLTEFVEGLDNDEN